MKKLLPAVYNALFSRLLSCIKFLSFAKHYPAAMATNPYLSEAALLAALKRAEPRAYEYLYRQYRPMILNFVRTNSGTQEEGLDLFQEGLLVLYEKLQNPTFTLTSAVRTYIYSVCRQKWLYRLRQQKPIIDVEPFDEKLAQEEEFQYPLTDKQLEEAIAQLKEPCRQVLTRFYYQKQSLEEIAQALDFDSANVAKVRRFRCMEDLKKVAKRMLVP
jgi:RNA polymerase sigma factor (sigma-70 family)